MAKDLHNVLVDGLFIAHQVRIHEVFLWSEDQVDADDHCFHEFAAAESTSEAPNATHMVARSAGLSLRLQEKRSATGARSIRKTGYSTEAVKLLIWG